MTLAESATRTAGRTTPHLWIDSSRRGLIIVGGPVGTGEHTAHLIESEGPAKICARLAEDPWAKDNHLTVGALDPWVLWLDGRRHQARPDFDRTQTPRLEPLNRGPTDG